MTKTFNRAFILFTFLYVFFFVKTWGSVTGNIYAHDDVVYYAQTASLVNDLDLDIKNNLGPYGNIYLSMSPRTGRMMSYQPLGPTLLYLIPYTATKPFTLFISAMRGAPFDQYDPLFFVVLCFFTLFLFYVSGLFIRKTLSLFFKEAVAEITAIFVLWGTILPVYVFRRPVFGVIPEFCIVSLLLYYILKMYKLKSVSSSKSLILGVITGLLLITRWNDLFLFPFVLFLLFTLAYKKEGPWRRLSYIAIFLFSCTAFLAIQALLWIKTYAGIGEFLAYYTRLHSQYLFSKSTLPQYLSNFCHILVGGDWGVLFTMPVLLFGGIAFIFNPKIVIFRNKAINTAFFLLTFLACFYVVLQWRNTGEFYGYRFLVSLLPFAALGFAGLIEEKWEKYQKILGWSVLFFCVFNFFILLPFELTEKTTMLPNNITPMGGPGWGNNAYFINALKFYFFSDPKTLISAFMRGYLAASGFFVISILGTDLARFGDKVKNYFTFSGYKSIIAFLYVFLILIFFYFTVKTGKRKIKND